MRIEVGSLSLHDLKYDVYILTDNRFSVKTSNTINLTNCDLDLKWIENIESSSVQEGDQGKVCDDENRFFIFLYLYFSVRRRIYYEDVINLYRAHADLRELPHGIDLQEYLWELLIGFMNTHEYKFKVLRGNAALYRGKPRVLLSMYTKQELISRSGLILLSKICARSFRRRSLSYVSKFGKTVTLRHVYWSLNKNYQNLEQLKPDGESGCLFFKGEDRNKQQYFIKCGTVIGSDIKDEYTACKKIFETTKRHDCYLLPFFPISQSDKLFYPFEEKKCSLKDFISQQKLNEHEFKKLVDFVIQVLKDLAYCEIIHRDIHMDNILVEKNYDNEIVGYKLIDFGCAVTVHHIDNISVQQKEKNRYAGNVFRNSENSWDDAASFLYMLIQIPGVDFNLFNEELDVIASLTSQHCCIIS